MDKLQSAFVGGWVDPEETTDLPFFSPPAKSAGSNVTVVVKEESKHLPSWTTDTLPPLRSTSILPLLSREAVKSSKQIVEAVKEPVNPAGWTSGIPDKMLTKKSDGIITYSPFNR